jgi:predicted kinase
MKIDFAFEWQYIGRVGRRHRRQKFAADFVPKLERSTVWNMFAMPECVILIGLPGAGKSSLYREKFSATHVHVSKDLWPGAAKIEDRQREMIEDALKSGRSVVVDNTNATARGRAKIIQIAREHGARLVGYFFDVTTRVAVARNAERTGRGKVPNVAIFMTAKRLERPAITEGFDELFRVELAKDRSLKVTKL